MLNIGSILADYKNVWPEADILLIEKYGIDNKLKYSADTARKDCPAQYLEKDSPAQRVADIKVVLDTVRKNGQYKKFILLGGSEGAVIANLVTADVTISMPLSPLMEVAAGLSMMFHTASR
ncbi:hypothetical protein D3C85_1503360 [compost metagenome]